MPDTAVEDTEQQHKPAPFRSVWANREFRGLTGAYLCTLAGDQLARVALTLLVYSATASSLAAASAYAVTLLPGLVGGPLLGAVADRYPRRAVMVACDALGAVLAVALAIPGMPLAVLFCVVFAVSLLAMPFGAARSSLVRDIFPDTAEYGAATTISSVTVRMSQVLGFTTGGVLVAVIGARHALLVDAASFAVSAVVVRAMVAARPAAAASRARVGHFAEMAAGVRLVFGDRKLRVLTGYAWLASFYVVPAGVVAPYAARHGGGPVAVGALLAAVAVGSGVSMVLLIRIKDPERRMRLMNPLALLAVVPLVVCGLDPAMPVTALLWGLSGFGAGHQLIANVAFVSTVPSDRRGQGFALVNGGMVAGQGAAVLATGALAQAIGPALVVAGSGAAGTAAVLALAYWSKDRASTELHAA